MSTTCGDVKRTAFVVDGGALVVVASWSRKTCVVDVSLEGLGDMVLEPNVPGLQCGAPPKEAGKNITLTIEPKSGALFVVYGATLAPRVAGLAGDGPCTQEKWWWSSPRKRGAHSFARQTARRVATTSTEQTSTRPARARKAPKSKEPKPKASLLARVGRLFRGDREATEPLGVRPSATASARTARDLPCRGGRTVPPGRPVGPRLPPDAAAFDSCGAPETCQKDQSPGPPARVDAGGATERAAASMTPSAALRTARRRGSRRRRRRSRATTRRPPSKACGGSRRIS